MSRYWSSSWPAVAALVCFIVAFLGAISAFALNVGAWQLAGFVFVTIWMVLLPPWRRDLP